MKIFENFTDISVNDINFPDLLPEDILLFDIETTGFSPVNSRIYLIGCLFAQDGKFKSRQYFIESSHEEAVILKLFFEFMNNYKYIIHFNGEGFDMPFIIEKCKKYDLKYSFDNIKSIDIYKDTLCLKKILKLENHKQKTLEKFLGLDRKDIYSGGDLINVYREYTKTGDEKLLELLLLHNIEDIKGLVTLSGLYPYVLLLKGNFSVISHDINEYKNNDGKISKEVIFSLKTDFKFPSRLSGGFKEYYVSISNNTAKLKINIYTDELKFFYPNYRDYYYLPAEDMAIHKSVAFYVDKNFRTQAKAANCYSKKTGLFLPQYEAITMPYFKIDYNDKKTYFEMTDEFLEDTSAVKNYIVHVLNEICK